MIKRSLYILFFISICWHSSQSPYSFPTKTLSMNSIIYITTQSIKGTIIGGLVGLTCFQVSMLRFFNQNQQHILDKHQIIGFGLGVGFLIGISKAWFDSLETQYNRLASLINSNLDNYPFIDISTDNRQAFLDHILRHFITSTLPLIDAFELLCKQLTLLTSRITPNLITASQSNPDYKELLEVAQYWKQELTEGLTIIKNDPNFQQQNNNKLQTQLINLHASNLHPTTNHHTTMRRTITYDS